MNKRLAFAVLSITLIAAACGNDHADHNAGSDTTGGARTVDVEMRDVAFSPSELTIAAGETIRFVFHNTGDAVHDAFVGDRAAQDEHAMEMSSDPGGMHHGDAGLRVEPGETGELTNTFGDSGTFLIGCHQPGHYAAGMKITITVS